MKKLMSSMLVMAAMTSMISCSTEDVLDNGGQVDNGKPVEIRLNAGVNEITTKAAIKPLDAFSAQIIARKTTDADYSTPLWGKYENGNISVAATSGEVKFDTKQYYPADGSSITMRGFAPQTTNITNNIVSYTIDGTMDIMVTEEVEAAKPTTGSTNTPKPLAFNHRLTQLQIKVRAQDKAAIDAWGKITNITINAVTTLELNLGTGELKAKATSPTSDDLRLEDFPTEGKELTVVDEASAVLAGSVMVLPSKTAYKLKITTEKNSTPKEIEITPAETAESHTHAVTLTFKGTEILATATAGPWTAGTAGTGTVE